MIQRISLPLLVLTLFLAVGLKANAAEPDAKAMVEGKYAEITNIVTTDKTDAGVRTKVVAVLESFTDFNEFGRLTLKRHWDSLKPKQQELFVGKYRQLIHKSYVKHFKANKPLKLTFREDPIYRKGKALVKTRVKSGKTTALVDYKLHPVKDGLMAYDIVIDDVSLMRSYRKQFGRIMKKDGFDVLIDKMTRKIEKGEGEIADP